MGIFDRRQFLKAGLLATTGVGSTTTNFLAARPEFAAASTALSASESGALSRNLLANGDFMHGEIGSLPDGWSLVANNPALKPSFELVAEGGGGRALMARGNGRRECYGYLRHPISLAGGKTYHLRAKFRFEDIEDVNRNLVHGVFTKKFNNGIFQYQQDGNWVHGEGCFAGPAEDQDGEVRLYFRYSASGKVWWEHVSLEECKPMPARPVKIAVGWGNQSMGHWEQWLDAAGSSRADIAVMPEMFNGIHDPMKAESEDGPSWRLMASKARQWKMHVSGSTYIRRGDLVYNSAPLFDRGGKLLGFYNKNMVYEPELDLGATPGEGMPVFQTDLGTVGIIICYDSWFPETVQLLALKGAELVVFPNAGYYTELMHARSADNGVFVAASSLNCPAGIWDSGGTKAGEERADPTHNAPHAILDFRKDDDTQMLLATVDLSRKVSPGWHGGPMRSAPGGRRCRETAMASLEGQIGAAAKSWTEA